MRLSVPKDRHAWKFKRSLMSPSARTLNLTQSCFRTEHSDSKLYLSQRIFIHPNDTTSLQNIWQQPQTIYLHDNLHYLTIYCTATKEWRKQHPLLTCKLSEDKYALKIGQSRTMNMHWKYCRGDRPTRPQGAECDSTPAPTETFITTALNGNIR